MKPNEFELQADQTNPDFMGIPKHFHPEEFCDVVEQMAAADEIVQALKILEHPPGYYRAYPTQRMKDIKAKLYKHIWNLTSYVEDEDECYEKSLEIQARLNPAFEWPDLGTMIDIPFCYPRAPIAVQTVKDLNEQGITPFIWEMGPANFWLPHGLKAKGLKFNYYAQTLNKKALEDHKSRLTDVWKEKPDKNQYEIFVCFETLEHLWNEMDIMHQYIRYGANAKTILLSTPLHTLLGGMDNLERDLGHLRTYTVQEFVNIAEKSFKGFRWESFKHHMQVLKGTKV